MHTKPKVTTAASGAVVTTAEVKAQLAIDWADDDALLDGYLAGAVDHLEGPSGLLGRFLLTQTWSCDFPCFSTGVMRLPFVDVQTVAIKYQDKNDVEQTLDTAFYTLTEDARGSCVVFFRGFVAPALLDAPYPITVEMTVGYGDASEVPVAIKVAIQMIVARWYENREGLQEGSSEIPNGVKDLVDNYRVVRV